MKALTLLCVGLALSMLLSSQAPSQSIDYRVYLDIVRVAEQSTVLVQSPSGVGTGLLFTVPFSDTSKMGNAFILTAKHVLAIGSPDTAKHYYDFADVYLNLKAGGKEKRRYTTALSSKTHDLVILRAAEQKRRWSEYAVVEGAATQDFFAAPESTVVGQYVIVAGFPAPIDIRVPQLRPVIQTGVVAQIPGGDTMLIDIHVNKGNSGGGAFTIDRAGNLQILGLVFGYRQALELVVAEVVRDKQGNLKDIKTEGTNSALGAVVSVSRLRAVAKQLLNSTDVIVID